MTPPPLPFRDAMARLGAAVNIVTTDGRAGRHGLTVSAVCSVTDDPPTVLVCVNRLSRSLPSILENGVLCVNVLAGRHRDLSGRFATRDVGAQERFGDPRDWVTLATGAPALADAPVSLDCRIHSRHDVGSHAVLYCTVVDIRLGDTDEGLIYFGRAYHALADDQHA